MKLLICSQIIDKNHPALGFFQRWIEEFAKHYEEVNVVCLQKGEFDLPENVFVYSLGKERKNASPLVYSWRLLKYAWQLRSRYDRVFVHMNPEYVLAGAPVWLLLRKPISLWYTHGSVSLSLRLAHLFVQKIFTAAAEGMNLDSSKVVVVGHGIDVSQHSFQIERDLDLITVGRISRSKNIQDLVILLREFRAILPTATLTVVGATVDEDGQAYEKELKCFAVEQGVADAISWVGGVSHTEVPQWLARAKVFVHTAKNGSLDKVLLEALAVGTPVVTTSCGGKSLPLGSWQADSLASMVTEIITIYQTWPEARLVTLQQMLAVEHSLPALIKKMYAKLT